MVTLDTFEASSTGYFGGIFKARIEYLLFIHACLVILRIVVLSKFDARLEFSILDQSITI